MKWPKQTQNLRNNWICNIKNVTLLHLQLEIRARFSPNIYTLGCARPPSNFQNVSVILIWHEENIRLRNEGAIWDFVASWRWHLVEACSTAAPKERTLEGCRQSRGTGLQNYSFMGYLPSLTLSPLSPVWKWIPPLLLWVLPLDESCLLKAWYK